MREIKFRAWVKRQNSMVPVNGIDFKKNEVAHVETIGGWEFGGCWYPIETVELMQFTGLYDKNGKEIYEGDVVSLFGGTKYFQEVFWSDEDCCFEVRDATFDFTIRMGVELKSQIEVIGNIYENPDLLEVEE